MRQAVGKPVIKKEWPMETLARQLSQQTLEQIVDRLALEEITAAEEPFLALASPAFGNAGVGAMRLWRGGKLSKMVYVGMTVPPIGLDSHMIFAFSAPDSPVPNFTLDSVCAGTAEDGEQYAFHLDLIPKCDLGVNLAYLRSVYQPLSGIRQEFLGAEGTRAAHLSTTQWAIMSPWMLARRASPEAFRERVYPAVESYLSHWFGLLDQGLDDIAGDIFGAMGAAREAASRALIFNREIDPVWTRVDRLLGEETSARILAALRGLEAEPPP